MQIYVYLCLCLQRVQIAVCMLQVDTRKSTRVGVSGERWFMFIYTYYTQASMERKTIWKYRTGAVITIISSVSRFKVFLCSCWQARWCFDFLLRALLSLIELFGLLWSSAWEPHPVSNRELNSYFYLRRAEGSKIIPPCCFNSCAVTRILLSQSWRRSTCSKDCWGLEVGVMISSQPYV